MNVTERMIFSYIVADTDPFNLQGGFYRIGTVINGSNKVQLQMLGRDDERWIDCLDNPITKSGLSGEINIVPGHYRFHLSTDDPISAAMTSMQRE
jgi:hypothetical protein